MEQRLKEIMAERKANAANNRIGTLADLFRPKSRSLEQYIAAPAMQDVTPYSALYDLDRDVCDIVYSFMGKPWAILGDGVKLKHQLIDVDPDRTCNLIKVSFGKRNKFEIGIDPDTHSYLYKQSYLDIYKKRSYGTGGQPINIKMKEWVAPAEFRHFESKEALLSQLRLDVDEAAEQYASSAKSRMVKIFAPLALAGSLLYACSSDAAELQTHATIADDSYISMALE